MILRSKIDKILGSTLAFIMAVMVINVLWQVFTRFIIGTPSSFTDELARYLMIWVGVLGAAYMLWLTKRVIFGNTNNSEIKKLNDVNKSEIIMLVSLAFLIIFFGFYPLPLMETFSVSVNSLINNYETALITN